MRTEAIWSLSDDDGKGIVDTFNLGRISNLRYESGSDRRNHEAGHSPPESHFQRHSLHRHAGEGPLPVALNADPTGPIPGMTTAPPPIAWEKAASPVTYRIRSETV
ncbi:hypothetical protein GCM10010518_19980 [Kitasatospora cinereorecta]